MSKRDGCIKLVDIEFVQVQVLVPHKLPLPSPQVEVRLQDFHGDILGVEERVEVDEELPPGVQLLDPLIFLVRRSVTVESLYMTPDLVLSIPVVFSRCSLQISKKN